MKRIFDFLAALIGLVVTAPILLPVCALVYLYDRHSPFYIAPRVGQHMNLFQMVKLRSMVIHADASGVDSTASSDRRITPVGHVIRKFKLDELSQLWNVLIGDMSFVGPRPNVKREVDLYTKEEQLLLSARPGITDFSSIVFADEGEILEGLEDPDLSYNQLIRPWKSRLGLFYIAKSSLILDIKLIGLTLLAILSREKALHEVSELLRSLGADDSLVTIALRQQPLIPTAPPGSEQIVEARAI